MLELKVLGCYGSRAKNKKLSSYLLLGKRNLALDAGNLCSLSMNEQSKIQNILLTHSHLDHCVDLPIFAYNNFRQERLSTVYSTKQIISSIQNSLFSSPSWIPFHEINWDNGIKFAEIQIEKEMKIQDYDIKAIQVKHDNESIGYLITRNQVSLFYTGDTGFLDEEFWKKLSKLNTLKAIIIECTYPDEQEKLASNYFHLCPKMLKKTNEFLSRPDVKFLATHFLPEYEATIKNQLTELRRKGINISWLEQGKTYRFE